MSEAPSTPFTPMTIAHANFHMLWGGQAEVVFSLSKSLSQRGHKVTIVCPPGSELEKRGSEAGLRVFTGCSFRKGLRPIAFARDVSRLRAFFRKENVQIYHCHGSQDHWIGALAASHSTRIVRTRHNIYQVRNHPFNRWLFRHKTAQVITIFSEQERYFTENGLLHASQLVMLPSPLPEEFVNPAHVTRVLRHELNLSDQIPLVGFVANSFHPDKAPLDFIAAAERVAKALPQVHFCMVGHGPLEEEMRAKIKLAGLDARFHLPGFRKDILHVVASFELLALTSVAREASSTVLKQVAAAGVPVVATDVGGTREVVDDGITGTIVKPGDIESLANAMLALLNNPARAAAMGAAGKEKVLREFTAKAIAERTEAVYRRLLEH